MFISVLCQHQSSGICFNYLLSDNNGRPINLSDKNRGNVDNTDLSYDCSDIHEYITTDL